MILSPEGNSVLHRCVHKPYLNLQQPAIGYPEKIIRAQNKLPDPVAPATVNTVDR
jgi:hypothetical protein